MGSGVVVVVSFDIVTTTMTTMSMLCGRDNVFLVVIFATGVTTVFTELVEWHGLHWMLLLLDTSLLRSLPAQLTMLEMLVLLVRGLY